MPYQGHYTGYGASNDHGIREKEGRLLFSSESDMRLGDQMFLCMLSMWRGLLESLAVVI
jgi:hypothetical protein